MLNTDSLSGTHNFAFMLEGRAILPKYGIIWESFDYEFTFTAGQVIHQKQDYHYISGGTLSELSGAFHLRGSSVFTRYQKGPGDLFH